jgi:hypothetical protein
VYANEFANLKADIAKNDIQQPIGLYEDKILDGRNRYKAAKEVGYKFTEADFREFVGTLEQAEAYVWSANYSRRNLTTAQKQAIIRQQIEKYPTWSNRKIARHLCLSSHATVAAVRDASNPALKRLGQTTPSGVEHGPAGHRVRAVQFLWIRHATP